MPEAMSITDWIWLLGGIFAVFVFLGLVVGLCRFADNFSAELRYLSNEIERTEGAERRYWIRRRKRLWLSLIPFVKY